MRTVWKFPFPMRDEIWIPMPCGAKILKVEVQEGTPCIWAEVNTESPECTRYFRITGTGHPVSPDLSHVASFQDRQFVWHMWE